MEAKWITRNPTKQQTPPFFPKMQNFHKHLIVFMLNRRMTRSRGWKLLKKIWKILTMVCKDISQPRELHSERKHSWDINFNYFRKITIVPGCLVDMPVCTEGENGGNREKFLQSALLFMWFLCSDVETAGIIRLLATLVHENKRRKLFVHTRQRNCKQNLHSDVFPKPIFRSVPLRVEIQISL